MININRLNKYLGTNYKKYKGCFIGLKYIAIKLDSSIIYFNKDLQAYTKIYNLNK